MADWQNRIVGYENVAVDNLVANPRNWRIHPQAQQDAFSGVVNDIGLVQNILVNKRTGYVIDGHMRVLLAMKEGQEYLPVTYVELSEAEEALVLASLDPIAAMAVSDAEQLDALLRDVNSDNEAVQQMLAALDEFRWLDCD